MKEGPHIIETSDGSHSIYIPSLKETYHSSHGAVTESSHVFIEAGLEHFYRISNAKEIKVFEVGFGTGLNALLAYQWAKANKIKLVYHSIEQFPLAEDIFANLNYGKIFKDDKSYNQLHEVGWEHEEKISGFFNLKKIKSPWPYYKLPENEYQVIFYDAFAPGKQPDMWHVDLIQKCYKALTPHGILVTYCAQGQFKRNMKSCGFEIEVLAGPPGKKEMVRGNKKISP